MKQASKSADMMFLSAAQSLDARMHDTCFTGAVICLYATKKEAKGKLVYARSRTKLEFYARSVYFVFDPRKRVLGSIKCDCQAEFHNGN